MLDGDNSRRKASPLIFVQLFVANVALPGVEAGEAIVAIVLVQQLSLLVILPMEFVEDSLRAKITFSSSGEEGVECSVGVRALSLIICRPPVNS